MGLQGGSAPGTMFARFFWGVNEEAILVTEPMFWENQYKDMLHIKDKKHHKHKKTGNFVTYSNVFMICSLC